MKKLFLSSFAATTIDLVKDMLPKPFNQCSVAFIPTAADLYEDKFFVDVDRSALIERGCAITDIDLKTTQGDALEKTLSEVDIVFVAGGNTFYLLYWVKKSGFDVIIKRLIDTGIVYIGSSAGSLLCCPSIEIASRFDDQSVVPNLTDYSGLNLVNVLIIPHTQKEKYKARAAEATAEWEQKGYKVVHLKDTQAVLAIDDEITVVEVV